MLIVKVFLKFKRVTQEHRHLVILLLFYQAGYYKFCFGDKPNLPPADCNAVFANMLLTFTVLLFKFGKN